MPTIHPTPPGEPRSNDYRVTIDGQEAPVQTARVSAVPLNQGWPGYQRPLDQTELAGFVCWDMDAPVEVQVQSLRPIDSVVVRPASRGIEPRVEGDRVGFRVDRPGQLTVEVNGYSRALHLFANEPEVDRPDPDDPDVLYFGPGVHEVGKIEPVSGQTIYIAAGAVVYGCIDAWRVFDLTIRGRGVLDSSRVRRGPYDHKTQFTWSPAPFAGLDLHDCHDVTVAGIVLRDPPAYALAAVACRHLSIENVKLIGLWRYNADGVHLHNCEDCSITDSFVRSFDDSIVLTGLPRHRGLECGHLPMRNVRVERCVVWNEWGRALEIGAANTAPVLSEITFRDIDVIHVCHVAMDILHFGPASIRDIRFEDIRVEADDDAPGPRLQQRRDETYRDPSAGSHLPRLAVIEIVYGTYSWAMHPGRVDGVAFDSIGVTADRMPESVLRGFDADHRVTDVRFAGVRRNGRPVADENGLNLTVADHVDGVTIDP